MPHTRDDLYPLTAEGYKVNKEHTDGGLWFVEKRVANKVVRVVHTDDEQTDLYLLGIAPGGWATAIKYTVTIAVDAPASVVLASARAMEFAVTAR